jgi:hypothetical protein
MLAGVRWSMVLAALRAGRGDRADRRRAPAGVERAGRDDRRRRRASSARTRCAPRCARARDDDVVVVHDAARPLVTAALVEAASPLRRRLRRARSPPRR